MVVGDESVATIQRYSRVTGILSGISMQWGVCFSTVSGTVRNLGVQNYRIIGVDSNLGVIAVTNTGEVISCFTAGEIVGSSGVVGGLVAINRGRITTSYSYSSISGVRSGGLLVGNNYGEILACYAYGDVTTTKYAGGLVAWNNPEGVIKNCYVIAEVVGALNSTGGVLGGFYSGATHSNVYWVTDYPDMDSGLSLGSGKSTSARNSGKDNE